jgi:hypothetical protein
MLDGDMTSYCDVDRLLSDVHARGMRLLVDWVPNQTSDRHPRPPSCGDRGAPGHLDAAANGFLALS